MNPDVEVRLLTGSRGCENQNNSSLVTLVTYKRAKFLFTGDGEIGSDNVCSGETGMLIRRFRGTDTLRSDVLKLDHHGSFNGVDEKWIGAIQPKITVISAGQVDSVHRAPGGFHAWQFGHPREKAITIVETGTTDSRTPCARVTIMKAAAPRDKRKWPNAEGQINIPRNMRKGVYCTCWDGDIVMTPSTDGQSFTVGTSVQVPACQ